MAEPKPNTASPAAATTSKTSQLLLVVAALQATPERLNPATQLYYQLYLEYTFGSLDIGKLLLQKDVFTKALQNGKQTQETAQEVLKKLRALPSRSSHYVPL